MRTRSRVELGFNRVDYNDEATWPTGSMSPDVDNHIQFGSMCNETMIDDPSSPEDRSDCKVLNVTRYQASQITGGLAGRALLYSWLDRGPVTLDVALSVLWTPDAPSPGSIDWGSMVSSLARDCRGKLNNRASCLVVLGQLSKTFQMVRNPFGLLKEGWRIAAGRRTANQLAKLGTNLWLEGRFGWNICYGDCKRFARAFTDAEKAVNNVSPIHGEPGEHLTQSQTSVDQAPISTVRGGISALPVAPYLATSFGVGLILIQTTGCLTRAKLFAIRRDPVEGMKSFNRFRDAFGATGSDVLSAIWDLVPFSFVVDWFVNYNGFFALPDYEYLKALRLEGIGSIVKTTWSYKAYFLPLCYNPGPVSWNFTGSTYLSGDNGLIECVSRSGGLPNLDPIMFNFGMSSVHSVDSVALVLQRMHL